MKGRVLFRFLTLQSKGGRLNTMPEHRIEGERFDLNLEVPKHTLVNMTNTLTNTVNIRAV